MNMINLYGKNQLNLKSQALVKIYKEKKKDYAYHVWKSNFILRGNKDHIKSSFDGRLIPAREGSTSICGLRWKAEKV